MSDNSVIVLTAAQLKDFATDIVREALTAIKESDAAQPAEASYVYGLRGIRNLFNVSHTTAQIYKNTFLREAVEQRGRKFRVNVAMAQRLFAENRRSDAPCK